MSLEAAFHQHWSACPALNALLPVERLKTGLVRGAALPWASLARTSCRTVLGTSAGDRLDEVKLEVRIGHDDHDAGRAIVDQLDAAFDRSSFAISSTEHAIQVRRTNDSATERAEGGWEFLVEILVHVHHERV